MCGCCIVFCCWGGCGRCFEIVIVDVWQDDDFVWQIEWGRVLYFQLGIKCCEVGIGIWCVIVNVVGVCIVVVILDVFIVFVIDCKCVFIVIQVKGEVLISIDVGCFKVMVQYVCVGGFGFGDVCFVVID